MKRDLVKLNKYIYANHDELLRYIRHGRRGIFKSRSILDEYDLVQEGWKGLMNAVHTYEPDKGNFEGLVVFSSHSYMMSAVNKNGNRLERDDINYVLYDDTVITKKHRLIDADRVMNGSKVFDVVGKYLNEREFDILKMYYSMGFSYMYIGLKYGITKQGVKYVVNSVIDKLHKKIDDIIKDLENII